MGGTTRLMATPRALALGVRLKHARLEAGYNQRELASRVGMDHSTVGRYETGEREPKPEKVAAILQACGVVGAAQDELVQMSRDLNGSHWTSVSLPERRLQLSALLEFERDAIRTWSIAPLLFPGRLQIDDYCRAIMTAAGHSPNEVEEMVALRMGRRELINRPDSRSLLVALISESVLHTTIGGPGVMDRQLRYLDAMTKHPNVEIRIIPAGAGWHPGLEGPFLLLEFGDPTDTTAVHHPPIVHLEARESSLFLHEPRNVAAYQMAVQMVLRVAMSPEESAGLIAREADNH